MPKIRVLLADDHEVVREGLKALVNAEPDLEVIGEANNGQTAWRKVVELRPDIAVIDISMPQLNGIQTTERVKQNCPQVKVLALTAHQEKGYLDQLLRVGASGYVLKLSAAKELIRAIRTVAVGKIYVDREMNEQIKDSYVRKHGAFKTSGHRQLTEREEQVLRLIAEGNSNKEIASRLNISVKTVESHKANLMEKLQFKSRTEIVRYAVRHGWLQDN